MMSQRKCPHCGELVQSNSLTCPKCFKSIPREESVDTSEYVINDEKGKRTGSKSPNLTAFLAIFPAFVGILGLGMIYQDPRSSKGYWFLIAGLILFLPFLALFFTMLDSGFLSAILLFIALVIIILIYISAAIAAFVETMFGSIFKVFRF